jgi:hypothetical protein
MEIKLTDIRISERLTKETTAFESCLWINGIKVAKVGNYGQGGPNYYLFINDTGRRLIDEADAYCQTLPPRIYASGPGENPLKVPMSIETMIDGIVFEHLLQQDLVRFRAKMEKQMFFSILFGIPDTQYQKMKYTIPISVLCNHPKGIEILKHDIHMKVLPLLTGGKKILNNNIPPEVKSALALPDECWTTPPQPADRRRQAEIIEQMERGLIKR